MAWQVDSETGVLTDVLLCRPENYHWIPTNAIATRTIASGRDLDQQRLQAEYRELEDALEQAGTRLHYLIDEPHLPYQVYTRDSSQMTPWGPFLTQLYMPQRRGEYASVLKFYGGSEAFWGLSTIGTIEGGDIHIIRPGLLAIGHSGGRTNEAGAEQFAKPFREAGWEVWLEPFDEHFLHLDVIFSMVTDGLALACREVLSDGFIGWLAAHGIRTLDVGYGEAMHEMGCNVLALGGDRVISPRHGKRINDVMRAEGISVLDPDLELFAAGGGSVHCMTMPLKRESLGPSD